MMLSLFFYRAKCMLKNKSLIFWTMAFPFILTTLFASVLKGAYDPERFKTISIAVVDTAYYQNDEVLQSTLASAKFDDTPVFQVHEVSKEEAKQMLADNEVDAIITNQEKMHIDVSDSTLNTTIVSSFFTEYEQKRMMVKELMEKGTSLEETFTLFQSTQSYIQTSEKENDDLSAVFFYTVLAMVCLFGGQWSMVSLYDIQANQSSRAARMAMTPVHKIRYLLCDFLLCLLFELIFVLIIYAYMAFFLDIAFGEHLLATLGILLLGCLSGNAIGTFIGCATTKNMNFKTGVLTAITMVGSFLSGMMMVEIKYLVQLYMPVLNYVNPVAMITDGLYSLYYYGIEERYLINVTSLFIVIILFYGCSFLLIKKKRYASLEAR